jgi:hypothetical protein
MTDRYLRLGAGIIAGVALASCGVISEDATNFNLALPAKSFTINADGWQVGQPAADAFLTMACDSATMACSATAKALCKTNCSGSCNATTTTCDLSLDISLAQPINLVTDQPQLKALSDQSTIRVSIDSVTYEIPNNSLTVDTPELTVYAAPMSVTASLDPLAIAIGTIAQVPAGWTTTGPESIAFTATGKATLAGLMSSFKTPFNVLVGSSIHLTQGEVVPSGELDAVVHITGHAGL